MKYITGKSKPLTGKIRTASDKSISHRALMFGLLNHGKTIIRRLLDADDVSRTMRNCAMLGAKIEHVDDTLFVSGGQIKEPNDILDFGNSGTGARLSIGLLSSRPMVSIVTGDSSLRTRPMKRIIEPLCRMGAAIYSRKDGYLPAAVIGNKLKGIKYVNDIGSAQVKSAIMLAALACEGKTIIEDPKHSRDHTERLLIQSGADINIYGSRIEISGSEIDSKLEIMIPADFSSAAFLIAYALLKKDSDIILKDVGINPTRTGMLNVLKLFGAKIDLMKQTSFGLEPAADIHVTYQKKEMRGAAIPQELVVSAIDEIPIIAAIAASIEGKTVIKGAGELRYKESDRIDLIVKNLTAIGVKCTEYADGFEIEGSEKIKSADIITKFDHRIAMSFIILGSVFETALKVSDIESIKTSYPGFFKNLMLPY